MRKRATAVAPHPTTLYASVSAWLRTLDTKTAELFNDGISLRFWLAWAECVLKSRGVDPTWHSVSLGDLIGLAASAGSGATLDGGRSESLARVTEFRDTATPRSPEWHAATLWLEAAASRDRTYAGVPGALRPVRSPVGDSPRYSDAYEPIERPARAIGRIYAQIERERLRPDAEKGRAAQARLGRGGIAAAKVRECKLGRANWRKKALRLDSMEDDMSRKERANLIAERLGALSWRTVYDFLPSRRRKKSSR